MLRSIFSLLLSGVAVSQSQNTTNSFDDPEEYIDNVTLRVENNTLNAVNETAQAEKNKREQEQVEKAQQAELLRIFKEQEIKKYKTESATLLKQAEEELLSAPKSFECASHYNLLTLESQLEGSAITKLAEKVNFFEGEMYNTHRV